mmetsp:Transcript_20944/g.45673  ORF Transcript_20944/g.45673 Transcript_20944/m.45673 type:complete len:317 (+) Transcript_20944:15-965(+)
MLSTTSYPQRKHLHEKEVFTEADEKKEQSEMTNKEKADVIAEIYGQVHPNETPDLVSESLKGLTEEIDGMPAEKRVNWEKAKERCPELTGDRHKLMFLRCEVFNVGLAALRLLKYWDKRVELFGEDKAFLPLTLDGALRDDEVALEMSLMQSTEATDEAGRRIVLGDPSRLDKTKYTVPDMVRAFWYTMHAVLEDEMTQKRGVILLLYPHHAHVSQFDRKLIAANAESMKGILPVRIGSFQICHPPTFFQIVFPVIKFLLGKRLRQRIKVHAGSKEHVLERLAHFGIPKESVPSDLGGDVVLDQKAWLAKRKELDL